MKIFLILISINFLLTYILIGSEFGPKKVKVVVVTLFERGEVTSDDPGEFQLWVERYPLSERIPFPHGNRDLYWNDKDGVLGMVTGIGTAKAAASITAVALDPRFDFSQS